VVDDDILTKQLTERERLMTVRSKLSTGIICAALVLTVAGCSSTEAAPASSPTATPSASSSPEPSTAPTAAALQEDAKVVFSTLPEANWVKTYADTGSSAIRENELDVAGLKAWISSLAGDGWKFTSSEDSAESLVGYLLKDDRVLTVISSTNPDNGAPTTAVFYYSDSAWTGTSTQS
jgi:hypothetical protein